MDMAAFRSRIDTTPGRGPNGDCHMWLGHKRRKGYGDFRRKLATHIVLEEAGFARPSKEYGALHSCDNPSCVNLAHLRWGTAKMNAEDVAARHRHRETKKTHCKRGHEFTPENTARRTHKGVYRMRACKQCQRERRRRERLQEKIMKQQKLEQALTQQRGEAPAAGGVPFGHYWVWKDGTAQFLLGQSNWALESACESVTPLYTTPQPSADAVRELVRRWRIESNWRSGGVGATYKRCADELESLLSAASGEGVGK